MPILVDSNGTAIAYPDRQVITQATDLSVLPQVHAALRQPANAFSDVTTAHDLKGASVLTAHHSIQPLGWVLFVEQPAAEAFGPIYQSLFITGALLLIALIPALLLSLLFARRMAQSGAGAKRRGRPDRLGHPGSTHRDSNRR